MTKNIKAQTTMTKNEDINKTVKELKAKIKANSKDAHFADTLIEELLTAKARMGAEPIELNVGKRIDSWEGETFEIVKTDRGCLYHEYGGYNIFVTFDNNTALYRTLCDYVDNRRFYDTLDDEEKERYELTLQAVAYCLSVPKFCFTDAEFTFDLASMVVKFLREQYEKYIDEPLQEETIVEDKEFEQAVKAVENIKDIAKEVAED